MFKFFLYALLIIITIACGNANSHEPAADKNSVPTTGSDMAERSLTPMFAIEQKGKDVILHFNLKNQSESVKKYTFPTSQRFDYIITSSNGQVVTQFSKGRMFNQVIGTVTLKPGEALAYDPVVKALPKGSYLVTFWLTAREEQYKTTASFTVE